MHQAAPVIGLLEVGEPEVAGQQIQYVLRHELSRPIDTASKNTVK
jgi:hypothetical protein